MFETWDGLGGGAKGCDTSVLLPGSDLTARSIEVLVSAVGSCLEVSRSLSRRHASRHGGVKQEQHRRNSTAATWKSKLEANRKGRPYLSEVSFGTAAAATCSAPV